MSIRDTLNKNPKTGAIIVILLAAGLVTFALWSSGTLESGIQAPKQYFSTDDGATFFAADAEKLPPFEKDGKQAYRAGVYRIGGGTPFVAYLERINEQGWKKMNEAKSKGGPVDADALAEMTLPHIEVKKPGQKEWIRKNTPAGGRVTAIQPPAGAAGELEPVYP